MSREVEEEDEQREKKIGGREEAPRCVMVPCYEVGYGSCILKYKGVSTCSCVFMARKSFR